MKKNIIGSIIRIPLNEKDFCYARILKDGDYAFYELKTSVPENDLENIVSKPILFCAHMSSRTLEDSKWEIIGKLPLDERHSIAPIYFDPDLTNTYSADYTIKKIQETLKYKIFEKGGLQDGGIYSYFHIEERLNDYFEGKPYKGIVDIINMVNRLAGR